MLVLVYLSGPIIHSNLRKDSFYEMVVQTLESKGISVFAPQFLGPAEPVEIYSRDVDYVRKSDVLIAEVSNPSLGVGMEIMLAILLRIPILLFRSKDANRLSKMVVGADGKALFEYDDVADAEQFLNEIDVSSLMIQDCPSCDSQIMKTVGGEKQCVLCGYSTPS